MGQSAARLAQSRAGEATKTSQRRLCRKFAASGRRRTLRCWPSSAGGHRTAAHGVRVGGDWMWGRAVPSRGPFRGLGKNQTAKVVRGLGCLAAGCKEGPFVGLQEFDPGTDIARVPNVTVKGKF